MHPLDWQADAACRGMGTDMFFLSENERFEAKYRRVAKAVVVCRACPVITACADWARGNEGYGVWGGKLVR